MHGKVGTRRKVLAERHPGGRIKHTRSEDRELRRSPAFQRRVIDIVTEAVALVKNPDTGSQIGLALLRFDLTQTQAAAALNFAELRGRYHRLSGIRSYAEAEWRYVDGSSLSRTSNLEPRTREGAMCWQAFQRF